MIGSQRKQLTAGVVEGAFEVSWIVEETVVIQESGIRRLNKGPTREITIL